MKVLSVTTLTSLVPLLSSPLIPTDCQATVNTEVNVNTSSAKGTSNVDWKYTHVGGRINGTLAPHASAQVARLGGGAFDLPANNSNQAVAYSIEAIDPVVMQIPVSWTLTTATLTTPLGNGSMLLTPGPIPTSATIDAGGKVNFASYYTPEANGKLYMGVSPQSLIADGPANGKVKFEFPPGPSGLHLIKFVAAVRITLNSPLGPVSWYPPFEGVTDFALVTANHNLIVADATSSTACNNSLGRAPQMRLPTTGWNIGQPASLEGAGFVPGSPVAFVLGLRELSQPFPLGVGGCKLRVDPTGAIVFATTADPVGGATIPLMIPLLPALVGASQASQAAEFNPPGSLAFTNHMKSRI